MMEKVNEFIEKYHMLAAGDKVIAGISGGADSVCLLFVLLELREAMGIEFVAVHVNHGLRGSDADRDEQFVRQLCQQHQVECEVYHENVESIAKKRKQSVEEAGRMIRREAFEHAVHAHGANKIAMAHHQNDNAETLLMNLARGTGLKGLGGIRPVAGHLIRPLLCLERLEIEHYIQQKGCGFCQDKTNEQDEFTRNRLRHQVIPILEEQVNSRTVRHMNETMEQIRLLQEYMEIQTEKAYEYCVEDSAPGILGIRIPAYETLHEAVKSMLIKLCLSKITGSERNIHLVHVEAVQSLFGKQSGRGRNLPRGVTVTREYGYVVIRKVGPQSDEQRWQAKLSVPGVTEVPSAGVTVTCSILAKPADFSLGLIPEKPYTKWFDYDIIQGDLCVRNRQRQDRIAITREGKRQKIKAFFINEKIPLSERDSILLIANDKEIMWILGYRMSTAYQVTEQTRRILEIKVTEDKENGRKN